MIPTRNIPKCQQKQRKIHVKNRKILRLLFKMPSIRSKKSHKECLKLMCIFCHEKSAKASDKNPRQLSENVKKFIAEKKYKDFRQFENEFPSGICTTCIPIVHGQINLKPLSIDLPAQNFEETLKKLRKGRSNDLDSCSCFVCEKVKKSCITGLIGVKKKVVQKKVIVEKKCDYCFATISHGKHKNCNQKERVNNLMVGISPKTRRQLCLETIREEQKKKTSSSPIRVSRLSGGPAMPIVVGSEAVNQAEP